MPANRTRNLRHGALLLARVLCLGGAMLSVASAQSLRETRAREADDAALQREIAYTRSICESRLSGSINWRSAADWPEGRSLAAACDGALGALEAVCRSGDGKDRARRVTRFVCAGDGGGASLRGGTLRYGARPNANGFSETKTMLDRQL